MKNIKITQSITNRQDASLGMYFRDVSKQSLIDSKEEIKLAERIKKGDQKAIDKLVKANLRFVISVAKQYQNKGLSLVDLIQEGNIGLIEGAKRYDETKGFKFISYAVWWIRQAIIKAISSQCRTVRIPMNQVAYMNKINKTTEKFEQENERKPSIDELELQTGISADKIALNMSSINRTLSLDTAFKDEESGCLLDIIPNQNSPEADNLVIDESISKEVEEVLSNLSYREGDILRMIFGIRVTPMTMEEIASRFGIGAERVRQIQHEALKKIKNNYSDILKGLL